MTESKTDISATRNRAFSTFAETAASVAGTPLAFVLAVVFIFLWIISGPLFGYSQGWQMVISTVPTVTTFLLVFLIQNSQNRETRALQLKLNELIRATQGAHTMMLNLEKLTEQELRKFTTEYETLAQEARNRLARGQTDQHVPEISLTEKM